MRCRVSAVSRFGCSHSVPEKKFRQNRFRQKSVTRDCGSKEFSWKVPAPKNKSGKIASGKNPEHGNAAQRNFRKTCRQQKTNPVKLLPAEIRNTGLRLKVIFVERAGSKKQIRQNRIRQKSGARECGSKEFS